MKLMESLLANMRGIYTEVVCRVVCYMAVKLGW